MTTKKIADQLRAAETAIYNSLELPEILARVKTRGYTVEKLTAAAEQYKETVAAVAEQDDGQNHKAATDQEAATALKDAKAAYVKLVKDTRMAFPKNDAVLRTLGIPSRKPLGTNELLTLAKIVLTNLPKHPEIAAKLDEFGYTEADRQNGLECVALSETAERAQAAALSTATSATARQTELLTALNAWLSQYLAFARDACTDQPHLLDALGLRARKRK